MKDSTQGKEEDRIKMLKKRQQWIIITNEKLRHRIKNMTSQ